MTIYVVMTRWNNYDGWGISDPSRREAFTSDEKARQYIYQQTGQDTALEYGHATVYRGTDRGDHTSWYIDKIEVTE